MQVFVTKTSEGAGPWRKAAQSIQNLRCGKVKIDPAVFLFQDGGQCRIRIVLWLRMNRSYRNPRKVSIIKSAPVAAIRGDKLSAVSSGAIGISC